MPLQSSHVFASHIGHTGKTTLCFQMSSYYATRHPDISVLVIDFAEEGDLTKRLLGGVDSSKKIIEELAGSVFKLMSATNQLITDSKASGGLTSWLFARKSAELDITKYAVRVADYNKSIPSNLYLVSSGAWPRQDEPMDDETRVGISSKIMASLQNSTTTWKLFCDTDGDRRPSPLTMMAYSLSAEAIVPLHLSKADLDRTETMLGLLNEYRQEGKVSTKVLFVVWNCVKSMKDEPYAHTSQLGKVEIPFTPAKVSLDILDACNTRLCSIAKDLPGLFVHEGSDASQFIKASTAVNRQLADNVLKPSEELGMPFIHMVGKLHESGKKSMNFKSGGVEYKADSNVITSVDNSLKVLETKFEAMSVCSKEFDEL